MCVNFTPIKRTTLSELVKAQRVPEYRPETFPGYAAPMIRADATGNLQADLGLFGLLPAWAEDRAFGKRTYNARSETVAEKPSYRSAWRARRLCLVPMEQFYEPCWETGKAVRWSIHRQDAQAFAVAGIWENWTDKATGEIITSFSMLTINADGHEVMGRFHRPGDERRSLVVVDQDNWLPWLQATSAEAAALLLPMNPTEFTAQPAPAKLSQPDLLSVEQHDG